MLSSLQLCENTNLLPPALKFRRYDIRVLFLWTLSTDMSLVNFKLLWRTAIQTCSIYQMYGWFLEAITLALILPYGGLHIRKNILSTIHDSTTKIYNWSPSKQYYSFSRVLIPCNVCNSVTDSWNSWKVCFYVELQSRTTNHFFYRLTWLCLFKAQVVNMPVGSFYVYFLVFSSVLSQWQDWDQYWPVSRAVLLNWWCKLESYSRTDKIQLCCQLKLL